MPAPNVQVGIGTVSRLLKLIKKYFEDTGVEEKIPPCSESTLRNWERKLAAKKGVLPCLAATTAIKYLDKHVKITFGMVPCVADCFVHI